MKGAVIAMLLVLAACGDMATSTTDSPTSTPTPSTISDREAAVDGPVMRYPQPSSSKEGMAAMVQGVLQLEAGCLYIVQSDIGQRFPVLWPAGTRWDEQNQTVVSPVGEVMQMGDPVEGGGGFLYVADVERLAGSAASALAAECVDNTYSEIAVVNNIDTAIGPKG